MREFILSIEKQIPPDSLYDLKSAARMPSYSENQSSRTVWGGGFFCGGSKGMFPDSRKPLLPAPGGCWEGKSAPAGRRFWNERSTDEKEKTYDKRCEWDEEKMWPSGTGQDA